MFVSDELVPDAVFEDVEGQSHHLRDYRQQSHLVVIFDPKADPGIMAHWRSAIQADRQQWDWLNVKILLAAPGSTVFPSSGAYVIDRYGIFLKMLPSGHWTFDDLEKEFIYYEACHC